jgi:DNA-binding FrmR family transcriptional regulator
MTGHDGEKHALITRLHRIEGQVRGIERMLDEDRSCIEVLTQIAAARTALEQVGAKLLERHVTHCIADALASADARAASARSAEMLDAVQRFVRTR